MARNLPVFLLSAALCVAGKSEPASSLGSCVDMHMGVRGSSHCVIGPQMPHGSVNPSPQTPEGGHGGYKPGKPVRGFGQLHVSGTGWGKYGQIFLSPQIGLEVGEDEHDSSISDETATPSYYSVLLDRYQIKVELSPTRHAAIYRFTFPESEDAHLLLDLTHNIPMDIATQVKGTFWGGELKMDTGGGNTTLSGWGKYSGGFGGLDPYFVYFYAECSQPPTSVGAWRNGEIHDGATSIEGDGRIGGYLGFKTEPGTPIHLKIGVSMSSVANAKRCVEDEITGFDFDAVRTACEETWEKTLGGITLEGASETQKRLFYTCLYHSFVMPHDRTGDNPKWNSDLPYWDDQFAIWDTWRTKFPLMILLRESVVRDNVLSFADRLAHNGILSDAFVAGNDGEKQGGDDLDHIIAEAYLKGVAGIDWEKMFAVLAHNANQQRYPEYVGRGWIPSEENDIMSCSKTLECAYNDFSAALVAKGMGKTEEHHAWIERSKQWQKLWDAGTESDGFTGFIRPRRADGTWVDFDPKEYYGSWKRFFYEAASWTYSFYVPHDFARLIALCGGGERFVERLDHAFEMNLVQLDNEPSFMASRAFHYAGRPDRTSCWVAKIMRELYRLDAGYPGNEDSGALGSWYVFSALGFFPNAGQDVYLINGPFCRKLTLTMENGNKLVVEGVGASEENIYVQEAAINGRKWDKNWFTHDDIKNGGRIEFRMGPAPSDWGRRAPFPPSLSDPD